MKPTVSTELIEHLESIFPDKLPSNIAITPPEMYAAIGEQKVIRKLRQFRDEEIGMANTHLIK
jgi:hypothetical protein